VAYTTTYRELLAALQELPDDVLDEPIAVERLSAPDEVFFAALETAGHKHSSLPENMPIIYVEDVAD